MGESSYDGVRAGIFLVRRLRADLVITTIGRIPRREHVSDAARLLLEAIHQG